MFFKIRNLLIIFFLYPFFAWGTEELKGHLLDQYPGAVCNSGSAASYYLKKQDPNKFEIFNGMLVDSNAIEPQTLP